MAGSRGWNTLQVKDINASIRPGHTKEGTAAELRAKHPGDNIPLAQLSLNELVDHYVNIVEGLPEDPVVIGHSLGGLITQILVNRDLAAAGVAIHSAPPKGVFPLELSVFKASWKSFGLFTSGKKTYRMSRKDWKYAFTNKMSPEDQERAYEENLIPESKRVFWGGLTSAAAIDFTKPHAPLLLTSGDIDNIIPASLNERNFKRFTGDGLDKLSYKKFPGRNHFVLGQRTWKEDADYILDWLTANVGTMNAMAKGGSQ